MDCIFCKIANREIKSNIIYEDESAVAFLDISQTTPGHTLVVPKKHFQTIWEIDDTTFLNCIPMLAKHIKETLGAEGINVVNNSGVIAGQTVNHVHFHIIPRYSINDEFQIKFGNSSEISDSNKLELLMQKLEVK